MDMGSIPAEQYKWILHIKDHFSKYSMLYALTTKESSRIADFLQQFIKHYGVPDIIQSDNGKEFKGAVAILCKRLKIKVINGRPRHPQTQGLVEQANGVAKTKINAWMADTGSKYWPDALSIVEAQMNNQKHTSLPRHLTPYQVFHNKGPRRLVEAQIAVDNEWIELLETIDEDAINTYCNPTSNPAPSLHLNLAKDLIETLPVETEDATPEPDGIEVADEALLEEQDIDRQVLEHQAFVRDRMIQKYSLNHDIQQFEVDQIVTLKLPVEDRSALDDRRLFCKVAERPADHKYQLQCQYGIISNLYPTRQLNKVHPVLQTRFLEASND